MKKIGILEDDIVLESVKNDSMTVKPLIPQTFIYSFLTWESLEKLGIYCHTVMSQRASGNELVGRRAAKAA